MSETTSAPEGSPEKRTGSRTSTTAVVAVVGTVMTLALIGTVVALVVLWGKHQDAKDELAEHTSDVRDAREAAFDIALDMSTWDYRTVEEDYAWLEEDTSEQFAEVVDPATYDEIKAQVVQNRERAEAEILRLAAERTEDGRVTVLVFVDQVIRVAGEEPRGVPSRLDLTMVEENGSWVVDDFAMPSSF